MKICFCNGKGGVGKTSLSVLVSLALAQAGKDVSFSDRDGQRTASQCLGQIEGTGVTLRESGGDVVIVDTPPNLESDGFLSAVKESDIILLVTSPSPADLWTSIKTAEILNRLKRKDAIIKLLFNRVVAGSRLEKQREFIVEQIGLTPVREVVHQRMAYQMALLEGWAGLSPEAREEIFRIGLAIIA